MSTGYRTRQMLDMATEDRQRTIRETKVTPTLREAFARQAREDAEHGMEMLVFAILWCVLVAVAGGLVGFVIYLSVTGTI